MPIPCLAMFPPLSAPNRPHDRELMRLSSQSHSTGLHACCAGNDILVAECPCDLSPQAAASHSTPSGRCLIIILITITIIILLFLNWAIMTPAWLPSKARGPEVNCFKNGSWASSKRRGRKCHFCPPSKAK